MSTRRHCDICDTTIPPLTGWARVVFGGLPWLMQRDYELCCDCGNAAIQFLQDRKNATSDADQT